MKPAVAGSEASEGSQGSQRAGFYVHHTKGSHYYLKHPDKPALRVTLPFHNADLKRRTLMSIVEQAGFSIEEFLELL
jgi:predicted RNA binding protein YcfA (HicA-like mRNA interferase family)